MTTEDSWSTYKWTELFSSWKSMVVPKVTHRDEPHVTGMKNPVYLGGNWGDPKKPRVSNEDWITFYGDLKPAMANAFKACICGNKVRAIEILLAGVPHGGHRTNEQQVRGLIRGDSGIGERPIYITGLPPRLEKALRVDHPCEKLDKPTYADKVKAIEEPSINNKWSARFKVPFVCTAEWDTKRWIIWTDETGEWIKQ